MKKFLCLILAITLLVFCLASCSGDKSKDDDTEHVHSFADPTCKTAKRCSCGATEGEPLKAHTFENGVCKVCEEILINEIGSIARDKKTTNSNDGYSVATASGNITSIVAGVAVDGSVETVWLGAKITITQEAITSGIYNWEFTRNTYIEDLHRYEIETMKGTFKASEFSSGAGLTVTETEGFSNSAAGIMETASNLVNKVVEQRISPLVTASESNLTMADLGFAKAN